MTRLQKIENITVSFFLILLAVVLIVEPEEGYMLAFDLIALSWLIQSIRLLVYYFTMARFMIGGQRVLIKSVVFFDLAVITASLADIPRIYVMIYLVGGMIFVNLVDILRALDKKKCGSRDWKLKMVVAIVGVIIALVCLCDYKSPALAGLIYAIELVYSAIVRIINSFRRTKIVGLVPGGI